MYLLSVQIPQSPLEDSSFFISRWLTITNHYPNANRPSSAIMPNPMAHHPGTALTQSVHHLSIRGQYAGAQPLHRRARQNSPSLSFHNTRSQQFTSAPTPVSAYQGNAHMQSAPGDPNPSIPLEDLIMKGSLFHVPQSPGQPEQPIGVSIHAQSYKNLFLSDGEWTTYRRNYLSATVSYSLANYTPGARIRFQPIQKLEEGEQPTIYEVYGFALGVAGIITDTGDRTEMVQHTPKRDKGPQMIPAKQPMAPKGSEQRDLGSYGDGRGAFSDGYLTGGQSLPTEHLFQRLQYRSATMNNGRRRAAQQYYNFRIELFADVGSQGPQQYVRVAHRQTFRVIVRGRSPGHYVRGGKQVARAAKRRGGKRRQAASEEDESDQDDHPEGLSRHQGGGGGPGPGGASGSLGGGYNGMTGGGMGAYGQGGMLRAHPTGYPPQYDIRGAHMYGHGGGSGRMGHEASHRDAMDHHSKVFLPPYQGPVYEDQNGRLDMFNSQQGEQATAMQPSSLDMYNKAARLEPGADILPRPSQYMMRDNSQNSGASFDGRCASNSVYPSQGLMPGNIMLS